MVWRLLEVGVKAWMTTSVDIVPFWRHPFLPLLLLDVAGENLP
jgi:hypothetical protein